MKSLEIFLSELSRLDVKLWAQGDRLRCNAPKGMLTPELKTQLVQCKSEILEHLTRHNARPDAINFQAEATLDPTITLATAPQWGPKPANVFLTGATGFLGAFLLYELLQQTQANVYCLVRGENIELGRKKVHAQLQSYSLWDESFSSRIIPILGDLSQPLLGLTPDEFQLMASQVDVIYHNGAFVHLFYAYTRLKPINVLGTQEILRLACQNKTKPVHFVSSLSVVQSLDYVGNEAVKEEKLKRDRPPHLYNGYAESKWVAEQLVAIAQDRGVPVTIYRPGMVTGSSQTGVSKTKDLLSKLLQSCVQLGKAPEMDGVLWDLTPVDYVGQAIVHLSHQPESLGKIFHLLNPQPIPMSQIVDFMRTSGYTVQPTAYEDWRKDLIGLTQNSSEHPLSSLLATFSESFSEEQLQVLQLRYDCQNTLNALKDSSIRCPSPNAQLIHTYLSYFRDRQGWPTLPDRGLLASPQQNLT